MQAGEIRSVLIGWIYPAHAYMEYQAPSLQREFSEGGNELLLALRQFLGFKPLHTWKTWTNVKHMKHCKWHYFISTVEALVCNFVFYLFMFITFNVCGLFRHVHKHTTRGYSVLSDQNGASRSPIILIPSCLHLPGTELDYKSVLGPAGPLSHLLLCCLQRLEVCTDFLKL